MAFRHAIQSLTFARTIDQSRPEWHGAAQRTNGTRQNKSRIFGKLSPRSSSPSSNYLHWSACSISPLPISRFSCALAADNSNKSCQPLIFVYIGGIGGQGCGNPIPPGVRFQSLCDASSPGVCMWRIINLTFIISVCNAALNFPLNVKANDDGGFCYHLPFRNRMSSSVAGCRFGTRTSLNEWCNGGNNNQ